MGNRYLTVDEIHQEEERWCQEIEGEKRACKKCKYEAALLCNVEAVADTCEDDDSLSAVGCEESASTCTHVHKVGYSTAHKSRHCHASKPAATTVNDNFGFATKSCHFDKTIASNATKCSALETEVSGKGFSG